jgi:hypothetical protein
VELGTNLQNTLEGMLIRLDNTMAVRSQIGKSWAALRLGYVLKVEVISFATVLRLGLRENDNSRMTLRH